MPETWLTQQDIADRMDVSVETVKRWRERDGMPHTRLGRLIRVREGDFERWCEQRTVAHEDGAA